ncbi:TPA: hypothetical protein L6A81_12290 [Pseudomonas aeruginosa]|nr:hypothetical protein [Pseudomonas aeruginosa]
MSSGIGTSVVDLAHEIILDDELKCVIEKACNHLKKAGGDRPINRIKAEVRETLKGLRTEGRFSKEDLALVKRRIDDAIARRESELSDE